jgi:hypothetical protein
MKHLIPLILIFVVLACKSKPPKTTVDTPAIDTSGLTAPLYPYVQFIKSQIADVDSTPYALIKIEFLNGKQTDSSLTDKQTFDQLANAFIQNDVNDNAIRKFYREESFQDLTLNVVTFSISATNNNLPLQQADVLLNPETQKIKTIILKKNRESGDRKFQCGHDRTDFCVID